MLDDDIYINIYTHISIYTITNTIHASPVRQKRSMLITVMLRRGWVREGGDTI